MNNINFDNPWLLLLGIPFLLAAIIPFVIAIKKENRTVNNVVSFVIHILISIILALTIAKTTFELIITETNIYVLADVSYSSNQNLELIDSHIQKIEENAPKNSKIGVVCFARDYEILVEVGQEIKSVKEHSLDDSATNIAGALEFTGTLFKDNVIKRIVIISDGKETKSSNVVSIIHNLSSENVYVDAIYLDNNIKDDLDELQINQIEYVDSTYLGFEENVYAMIQSNSAVKGFVRLYCDGKLYKEKAVSFYKGYNTVSLTLNTSEAGIHKYRLEVSSDKDASKHNNIYLFNQKISEKVRMLFVSGETKDIEKAENLYGDRALIDFYVNQPTVPFTVEELCKYDEFVLSNIDVRTLNNHSQFVKSLDVLVSEFGKSLITLGNTFIQNNYEDETLMALNDMLPVKYGNNEQDEKLVTLVLDISRSMEQISKLIIAKEVVCSILDNLEDDVMVMIIAFFGEVGTVFSPIAASERELIKEKVRSLEAYQGTFMGSALEYTYDFVSSLPYSKNEVILISDGLPYGEQEELAAISVQKLAAINAVVSAIQVVTDTDSSVALMRNLSKIGKGYYYHIKDVKQVESLVLDQVLNSLTEVVLEANESKVDILLNKNSLVNGIDNLPNVKGLYNNSSKTSTDVILSATYTDITKNEYIIPLYSTWNYGNGKVSSFSSSISGEWTSYWNDADSLKVLSNIFDVNIPSKRIDTPFIFEYLYDGSKVDISINAPSLNRDSKLMVNIKCPDESIITKELVFDSEVYRTEIETYQPGEYQIELLYTLGELSYNSTYYFNISYLPEYDSFQLFEASNLYYMVTNNGEISLDGNLKLENTNSNVQKYIYDFTPLFMIISVALFVIDIMVRKLRLQDIKSLFKFLTGSNISKRSDKGEK